jgi:hypothetical protein
MAEFKLDRIEWVADPDSVTTGVLLPKTCLSRAELEGRYAGFEGSE